MRSFRLSILYILFLFFHFSVLGQQDTEFWFAVPEVTAEHADRPVYLRLSSFSTSSDVTISLPANPIFNPIQVHIPGNSTVSVDLSNFLPYIENTPANKVLPKGLYIHSSQNITGYYEVLGTAAQGYVNTDIYSLKGYYALGTYFLTSFQNYWSNESPYLNNDWSSINIIATENNTSVTITPTTDLVGHKAGIPFTVTLNKGETYCGRATSKSAAAHPAGTRITSDKPIAVTDSDDSVQDKQSYDLIGDQIIPADYTGTSYIFVNTGTSNQERGFITAIEDGTEVYLAGSAVPASTLNLGQTFNFPLDTNGAIAVTASKNVYAFQVAGGNELAGAILPQTSCSGSKEIRFTRSTSEDFGITLIVGKGGENTFLFDGNPSIITASNFSTVPGTGGAFLYARIILDNTLVPAGSAHTLTNSANRFHMGIFNGTPSPKGECFSFGYFSSFGKLELGPNKQICPGDSVMLNAGTEKDSYSWSTGDTTSTLVTSNPGIYWVKVTQDSCTFYDTIQITNFPVPMLQLDPDYTFCKGENDTIYVPKNFQTYQWNNGNTSPNLEATQDGQYILTVTSYDGCKASDTTNVRIFNLPQPDIRFPAPNEALCKDSIIRIETNQGFVNYLWNNGDSTYFSYFPPAMTYSVTVTDSNGCQGYVEKELDCSIYIKVYNLITPNGDGKNDYFILSGLPENKYNLTVFNRWGSLIYSKDGYDNSWNAEHVSDGLYFYILKHKEGKRTIKGWVQVLRK